jgi:hypothetical protein
MKRYAYVVFTRPVHGRDAEYNRWYTEQHVGDVLRVPGVVAAQRYRLVQDSPGAPAPYLAVYEIQSDDVQQTLAQIAARAGTPEMPISPALDVTTVTALVYEAIPAGHTR